jgi:hypothetical protein
MLIPFARLCSTYLALLLTVGSMVNAIEKKSYGEHAAVRACVLVDL